MYHMCSCNYRHYVLQKTPNLPKKFDKFGNYIQQTFKVTDDKVGFRCSLCIPLTLPSTGKEAALGVCAEGADS